MRKVLLLAVFSLVSVALPARAQFCPGAAPWVFDDVPVADPFCGYITWAAQHGITLGCAVIDANHRLYCPSDSVRRDQMAAFVNRLGNVRVEAVGTGPGLTGGPITGVGTINLAATNLLPTTACAAGQVPQWSGSAWACANVGGGGTVTSVGSGTGLTGGPIATSGTLSIATAYQLPQGCTSGQVTKSNGAGGWTCANDLGGAGTVTSVATGAGLTGGPITASGTINLAATQLMPTVACASGQVPQWNGSAWTCATPPGAGANITLQDSTSASVGNVVKPSGVFLHNFGVHGTFLGVNAGNFTMTGNNNTGIGYSAMSANATGFENTAVGAVALPANVDGVQNTAVGYAALANNTSGSFNTAVGRGALALNHAGGNTGLGTNALNLNTTGGDNTAAGAFALNSNATGSANTAVGSGALFENIDGPNNTAVGAYALALNTSGESNAAVGTAALNQNTLGVSNVAVGSGAGFNNTAGNFNVGVGANALGANQVASGSTAVGYAAMAHSLSDDNTAVGRDALSVVTTGASNTAIGAGAGGLVTTGSFNVHVANAGSAADTQTIRIGMVGNQTRTFVAGIRGVTTGSNNAVNVVVDSNGQLGTISSSRETKEDIADMGEASAALARLRPVVFHYKTDSGQTRRLQYGLIAEEVAEVYPGLVAEGADGRPETVMYQFLAPMLLNEYRLLRQAMDAERALNVARIAALESERAQQAGEIAELRRAVEFLMARTSSEGRIASR